MKIERLFTYCLLAGTICFASCDNEVATDAISKNGISLPEGVYPLNFTVAPKDAIPQTRVAENPDNSKNMLWIANTDKIGVRIGDDGTAGIYTITAADGSSVTAETQAYWQNTNQAYIYGWYPATTVGLPKIMDNNAIDLSNQSVENGGYLQFDFMKAQTSQTYQYNSSEAISLPFQHQMAKVNIKLQDKSNAPSSLEGAAVYILGYKACIFENGTVTPQGDMGDVKTCYDSSSDTYKAMITPQTLTEADNFIKIVLKDNLTYYYRASIELKAGNIYTYTVCVDPKTVTQTINISNDNISVTSLSDGNMILIKGNGTQTAGTINIVLPGEGKNVTIVLSNVNISTNGTPITITGGGTATILLNDEQNILTCTNTYAGLNISGEKTNVIISGPGTLKATGKNGGAAIGANPIDKCGNITIKNAVIEARTICGVMGSGAAIGSGWATQVQSSCGDIIIINSDITASTEPGGYGNGAAIGAGFNGNASCGNISITLKKGQTKDQFLGKLYVGGSQNKVGGGPSGGTCGTISWYQFDGTPIE